MRFGNSADDFSHCGGNIPAGKNEIILELVLSSHIQTHYSAKLIDASF